MPRGTVTCAAGQRATGQRGYRTLLAAVAFHDTHHTWPLGTRLRGPQSSIAQGTSGFPPQPSRSALRVLSTFVSYNVGFFFYDFVFLCVVVGQNQYPTATSGFLDGLAVHTAVLLDASHSRRVGVLSE